VTFDSSVKALEKVRYEMLACITNYGSAHEKDVVTLEKWKDYPRLSHNAWQILYILCPMAEEF
jgi:hypothetical protein